MYVPRYSLPLASWGYRRSGPGVGTFPEYIVHTCIRTNKNPCKIYNVWIPALSAVAVTTFFPPRSDSLMAGF